MFVSQSGDIADVLSCVIKEGDILLTQGAGDIGALAAQLGKAGVGL